MREASRYSLGAFLRVKMGSVMASVRFWGFARGAQRSRVVLPDFLSPVRWKTLPYEGSLQNHPTSLLGYCLRNSLN